MDADPRTREIEIFSTCPPSGDEDGSAYLRRVIDVARWSERNGCKGILVYTDNRLVDPWLVAQIILQSTGAICPLVAVQPVYMHPYAVAKMVASLGHLHGRRVMLNMVAGGFKNDLEALDDPTPHDLRYERLIEYTRVVRALLEGQGPLRHEGAFYRMSGVRLRPALPPALRPGIFVSGSSEGGIAAARALGATAIMYPLPSAEDPGAHRRGGPLTAGVRIGVIARDSDEEAWRVARARFPEDRRGQIAHGLAMKVSDSVWHKRLSEVPDRPEHGPYWLVPFQSYKTFCPYLVGSHQTTARELYRYIALGYRTFILDIPPDERDLAHIGVAFRVARQGIAA